MLKTFWSYAAGMKVLDCGCGVGGPMRTIASVSGAHVTGERARRGMQSHWSRCTCPHGTAISTFSCIWALVQLPRPRHMLGMSFSCKPSVSL
jgi:hypothetical protein